MPKLAFGALVLAPYTFFSNTIFRVRIKIFPFIYKFPHSHSRPLTPYQHSTKQTHPPTRHPCKPVFHLHNFTSSKYPWLAFLLWSRPSASSPTHPFSYQSTVHKHSISTYHGKYNYIMFSWTDSHNNHWHQSPSTPPPYTQSPPEETTNLYNLAGGYPIVIYTIVAPICIPPPTSRRDMKFSEKSAPSFILSSVRRNITVKYWRRK